MVKNEEKALCRAAIIITQNNRKTAVNKNVYDYMLRVLRRELENMVLNEEELNVPFSWFWEKYGKKVGKSKSIKLWKKLTNNERELIKETLDIWLKFNPLKFRVHPERYLMYRRWEDEYTNNVEGDKVWGRKT